MDQEDLVNRIQKLLRLSESPNESEAQLAAQKVQVLLQKYNLDEAEVRGHQGRSPIVLVDVDYLTTPKWSKIWEVRLGGLLAGAYFSKVLFSKFEISFIGRSLDVEITRDVFVRLRQVLLDLSFKRLEEYRLAVTELYLEQTGEEKLDFRRVGGKYRSQQFRRGWLEGVLEGVATQISRQKRSFETSVAPTSKMTGKELVSLRDQEILTNPKFPETSPIELPAIGDQETGKIRGQIDGSQISLHRADLENN